MRKVTQTRLASDDPYSLGNCFAAAVASVLDVDLHEVPDQQDRFEQCLSAIPEAKLGDDGELPHELLDKAKEDSWVEHYVDVSNWLRDQFGLGMLEVCFQDEQYGFLLDGDCLHIANGRSPRGIMHAVVMRGIEVVHDPHPSRDGIDDKEITHTFFVLLDPGRAVRPEAAE